MPIQSKRWARRLAVVGGALLIVGVVGFVRPDSITGGRQNWPAEFQSNGERIYFTATSASGFPIASTGGGMHMQTRQTGCVSCHRADRQGGRSMSSLWKAAPPLTPNALFKEADDGADGDGHGGHESYTDATLRRAITKGLDPDGEPLNTAMPRWSISEPDLADLIAFLASPAADAR